MARRLVALIVGFSVLGLATSLYFRSKEAGIEVSRPDDSANQPAALPVRIMASSSGEIRLDGRPVDPADLAGEVARIIASAEEASMPEPSFTIVAKEDVDNAVVVLIMQALAEAGATSVRIEPDTAE